MELLFPWLGKGREEETLASSGRKEKDSMKIGEKETISQLIIQFQIRALPV